MVVLINYPALDLKNTKVTWLHLIIISRCGFKENEGDMVVLDNYLAVVLKNTKVKWS